MTKRNFWLKRLRSDEEGMITPLMAMGFITSIAALGGGVDMTRYYLAQSQLQVAVDAAALAGGRTLRLDVTSGDTITEGSAAYKATEEYFAANFPAQYLGTQLNPLQISGKRDGSDVEISVRADGKVPSTFARIIGVDEIAISAISVAETSENLDAQPAEVMLVLDNTGSMEGSRILNLKSAVGEFLEVVYGDDEVQDDIAIGMLPYNTMVNVGYAFEDKAGQYGRDANIQKLVGYTDGASDGWRWKGCVRADPTIQTVKGDPNNLYGSDIDTVDAGAWDIGLDLPGTPGTKRTDKIMPFYYPPIQVDSFQDVNNTFKLHPDAAAANTGLRLPQYRFLKDYLIQHYHDSDEKFGEDLDGDGFSGILDGAGNIDVTKITYKNKYKSIVHYSSWPSPKNYDFRQGVSNRSLEGPAPNYQCPSPAKPISYSWKKSELTDYVQKENYALKPGTGTFHTVAMTWGLRLLELDDFFPRNNPTDFPAKRYIVFMTDGNFDSQDDGRTDQYGRTQRDTALTAYGTWRERELVNSESKGQVVDALILRFAKTCQVAKQQGIEIYTIAFEIPNTGDGRKTREMFRRCASNPDTHFFDTSNGNDLKAAYRSIASDLTELHLSR